MESDQVKTYQALVSCFSEFLLVAIHTLLFERGLYPQSSFVRARKFGNAVHQSRHPAVTAWINDAVAAVEKQLLKGTVRQVSLVVFSSSSVPLERFVFNTARFPLVSEADLLTPFSEFEKVSVSNEDGDADDGGHVASHIPESAKVDLNAQFRGLLSRLCQLSQALGPLPSKCTYTVAIETRDKPQGRPPIERLSAFIPSESQLQTLDTTSTRTTPVRTVDAGAFLMEAWVEETQTKLDVAAQLKANGPVVDDEEDEAKKRVERPVDPLLEAMEGRTYVK